MYSKLLVLRITRTLVLLDDTVCNHMYIAGVYINVALQMML